MKIRPISVFVLLTLMMLYISLTITMLYDFNCKEVEKASSTLYDENSLTFTISKRGFDVEKIKDKMPNDSVFFSQMLGNENIRGICFKSYYDQPKLKKGRFFTANDFDGENKLAVIGSDISTEKAGGKEFIVFNNEIYFVIGIVGYPISSRLDSMVFLSLNNDLLKQPIKEYVISGKILQENLNFLGNEDMFGKVTVFENQLPNLLHVVSIGKAKDITILLFLVCLVFNIYIALNFFVNQEKSAYSIKIMNGYTSQQIINEELKKLFFANVSVIIIGTVLTCGFISKKMLISILVLGKSIVLYLGITTILFFILLRVKLARSMHERKGRIK